MTALDSVSHPLRQALAGYLDECVPPLLDWDGTFKGREWRAQPEMVV